MTHAYRMTKRHSWVWQFMVPSQALKHAEKTMCGWWSRQIAGFYMGPSPFEQILPLQTCTWFLSSPSPTSGFSWISYSTFQEKECIPHSHQLPLTSNGKYFTGNSTNHLMSSGLFGQRSCAVLTLSVLAAGLTMKSYECHAVFSMFLPNRWHKFLFPW